VIAVMTDGWWPRADPMPTKGLELASEALESALDGTMSVDHYNHFVKVSLPKIVRILLSRR